MNKNLYPFQREGVDFLAHHPHALLADEPGLGKTLQAITAAEIVNAKSVVVVCPASVRSHWSKELTENNSSISSWTVFSYNQAVTSAPEYKIPFDTLILDESHFCKSLDSQRTRAIFGPDGLARKARYKWCLTGTPVLNRPRELYPMLKTLAPQFANYSYNKFTQKFCGAYWDGYGINDKGATNLDELSSLLRDFMLRRTKKDVFPDRTEPLVQLMPLDLAASDLREVYEEEELIGAREAKLSQAAEKFSQMGDCSRLLRLLGEAKIRATYEFCDDLLQTVEKIVVFAHHRDVISGLCNRFAAGGYEPVVLQGGMSDAQKAQAVARFQSPSCRVFIGQRQAAGIGINGLQNVCSTCLIMEPSWVPGETEQMIGRLDRVGQQQELVTCYLLYVPTTLEEAVLKVHERKESVIEKIVGN